VIIILFLLLAFLVACVVMTLVWWRQLYTNNAGIVDGWWAYLFGIIAMLYTVLTPGSTFRELIMLTMGVVWSFRLGSHLLIRNTGHLEEDIRYKKLREEYGDHQRFRMWRFFIYQAVSNVLLSVPFLLVSIDNSDEHSLFLWIGVSLWIIAIIGESIADDQLKQFKQDPSNKGKVCRTGLWNYSRHPNYFFEWLIWVSYAIVALDSPYGWTAFYCPLLMYWLLNNVTGIPMLEQLAIKSKGAAYTQYQQTTNAFFPWFSKDK
jgi:steroid 5-alpha reductase family enzyme